MATPASRERGFIGPRGLLLAFFGLLIAVSGAGTSSMSRAGSAVAPGSSTGTLGEALSPSTAEQKALVEHLRGIGAVFYGAWWCPACFRQKSLFGKEAGERLPYVECDKEDPGRKRCEAASIRAYPTWDLRGERREGTLSLEELKQWSGFGGAGSLGNSP
jgi:hypothetical protein